MRTSTRASQPRWVCTLFKLAAEATQAGDSLVSRLLSQREQVTIGELASFLGVSSVAATKHANRLEQKELVRRIRFFGEASSSPQAMRMAMA